jgi:hypothetical protein
MTYHAGLFDMAANEGCACNTFVLLRMFANPFSNNGGCFIFSFYLYCIATTGCTSF